ncbi:MAG: FAD-binding oxidoreductase, partial [Myxococcota bacterium]
MKLVRTQQFHDGRPQPGAASTELFEALRAAVKGEVRFDSQSRALYSMDASNFRHVPIGVVVPADVDDVVEAVRICHERGVPIVSRGGGTGLAGQSLNVAVVLDHSKHLRRVANIDVERKTAVVQPGTILDDLRERAQKVGLTYGPDPATHDRCTFGGMIGNNACGVHAVLSEFYGEGPRTEDNLVEMDVLTYDGLRMRVGETSDEAYREIQAQGGRRAEIYRAFKELVDQYGDAIRAGFPDIARRVSGYNLPALLPENGFNVAQALVGSEGTCVTVLEAKVRLCHYFPHRVLLLLGYPSVYEAADDVVRIRGFKPVGLEGIDRMLISFIKKKDMHPEYTELLPEGDGWLMVEFGGDTKQEAIDRAEEAKRALERSEHPPNMVILAQETKEEHLWTVRESGLGATAFVPDERDAWPGWEDSAVPVDQVGPYLRNLKKLYDKYDYVGSVYGHFGQGCVHTRISFDLSDERGLERYKQFTLEAAELCVAHGGSLSGEHGDGQQRSDLLPVMYSSDIMEAFRRFKSIWDPSGKMNPGRIVDPMPRDANLRAGPGFPPWKPKTRFAFPEDGGDFSHAALRCVGVGKCRSDSAI